MSRMLGEGDDNRLAKKLIQETVSNGKKKKKKLGLSFVLMIKYHLIGCCLRNEIHWK